jgi:hypothetical protein
VTFVSDASIPANCEVLPLWKESLFVALRRDHRLKDRTALGWPSLRDERFIIRQAKCDPELCERVIKHLHDQTPDKVIQKLNVGRETLMHLVGIGHGVTLTSEATVSTEYPDVIFRPISGNDETVQFGAVSLSGNSNPALRRLLSLAKEQAGARRCCSESTAGAPEAGKPPALTIGRPRSPKGVPICGTPLGRLESARSYQSATAVGCRAGRPLTAGPLAAFVARRARAASSSLRINASPQTDGTHARTTLLGDATPSLSNACPKGTSNFVACVRSLGLLGRPSTRGRLDKD